MGRDPDNLADNPKVVGSNPAPVSTYKRSSGALS